MSKKEQLIKAHKLLEKLEFKWKRANTEWDRIRIASYINHLESEVIANLI